MKEQCTKCKEWKDRSNFDPKYFIKTYLKPACSSCENETKVRIKKIDTNNEYRKKLLSLLKDKSKKEAKTFSKYDLYQIHKEFLQKRDELQKEEKIDYSPEYPTFGVGKYRGWNLNNVPINQLVWFLNWCNGKSHLQQKVEEYMIRNHPNVEVYKKSDIYLSKNSPRKVKKSCWIYVTNGSQNVKCTILDLHTSEIHYYNNLGNLGWFSGEFVGIYLANKLSYNEVYVNHGRTAKWYREGMPSDYFEKWSKNKLFKEVHKKLNRNISVIAASLEVLKKRFPNTNFSIMKDNV